MATYSTVKNVSGVPLPRDRAGRMLGAGEFGPANVDVAPSKGHVSAGRFVVVERPTGKTVKDAELDEGALRAFENTAALNASGADVDDEPTVDDEPAAPTTDTTEA